MAVVGGVLLLVGWATYIAGVGDEPGLLWLVPPGLAAAGVGVLVAAIIGKFRRRLAPLHAVRRSATSDGEGGPLRRARALPSMIAGAWRGEYPDLPRYQTLLWLVALVYVLSPIDFAPDFLPLIGITDDIGVGAWLLSSLYIEAGYYLGRRAPGSPEVAVGEERARRTR
jgi:hypothetical protein